MTSRPRKAAHKRAFQPSGSRARMSAPKRSTVRRALTSSYLAAHTICSAGVLPGNLGTGSPQAAKSEAATAHAGRILIPYPI